MSPNNIQDLSIPTPQAIRNIDKEVKISTFDQILDQRHGYTWSKTSHEGVNSQCNIIIFKVTKSVI